MTEESSEKPAIFLVENDLFEWEKPLKPGYMRLDMYYHAKTELIDFLGVDSVYDDTGRYKISADAAKYLANVVRLHRPEGKMIFRESNEPVDGTPEQMIIFNGHIAIYSIGKIPGTNLQGCDLERTGRIWLARKPTDIFLSDKGLDDLIFGTNIGEEEEIKRIESIINGYEQIERKEASAQWRTVHDSYQQGRGDSEEETFGTFGSGW